MILMFLGSPNQLRYLRLFKIKVLGSTISFVRFTSTQLVVVDEFTPQSNHRFELRPLIWEIYFSLFRRGIYASMNTRFEFHLRNRDIKSLYHFIVLNYAHSIESFTSPYLVKEFTPLKIHCLSFTYAIVI